ncbi:MAG: response regulator [Candidatus Komeilibacteria bacterium]
MEENIKQILIVEDDSFLLQMYTTKLTKAGYEVKSASDGIQALKKAKELKPDIILLDLLIPLKSGFEVLEELKIDKNTQDIPVIVLSNMSEREDVQKCLQLGAVDYLIKAHFVPSEVISKIEKIIS